MGRDGHESDILTSGSEGQSLWDRTPGRWRRRLTIVVTFLLGLVLGGYGLHLWHGRTASSGPDIHLKANLSTVEPLDHSATTTLTVYNLGDDPVTIHRVRLNVRGFTIAFGGPGTLRLPLTVRSSHPGAITVHLDLGCGESTAPRVGEAVFTAAAPHWSPRRVWVDRVVLAPEVRTYYRQRCGETTG
ncbi:MAG: hypothetical protein ACRDQA_08405 [Nocardioidaceae bacterium]